MSTTHDLKSWTKSFAAITEGDKRADFRNNDRCFFEGDVLIFREFDPEKGEFTGKRAIREASYVEEGPEWGIPAGFALVHFR